MANAGHMQITVLFNGKKQDIHLLDESHVVIGRGRSAHIALDGNPIVSRQHAVIRQEDHGHVIEDLGGPNGTFVNDFKITGHSALRPGDRVVLGKHTLRYEPATAQAVSLRRRPTHRKETAEDSAATQRLAPVAGPGAGSPGGSEIGPDANQAWGAGGGGAPKRRRRRRSSAPQGEHSGTAGTLVASKNELENMLERQKVMAGPHLTVQGAGSSEVISCDLPQIFIGHTDACQIRLPGSRYFGRIAGVIERERKDYYLSARSTFWNPITVGKEKLKKKRKLNEGSTFAVGKLKLRFSHGEQG